MEEKKLEMQKKLIKRMQGQVLAMLDEAETSTQENYIIDIDEYLSRCAWRYDQLIKTTNKEDK